MSFRVAFPAAITSDEIVTSGWPSACEVTDQTPGGTSANEYTPSLPDTVARMPPPSARTAVTVAWATGPLPESVTTPTIAPNSVLGAPTAGVEETAACAAADASPAAGSRSTPAYEVAHTSHVSAAGIAILLETMTLLSRCCAGPER
jgi:hypothetical protein